MDDLRIDNYQNEIKIVTVTGPASEPVTVAEIKSHLRIDHSDDDTLLGLYIQAARETVEAYTGRRMISRTEKLLLDRFPCARGIVIPAAPVYAISSLKTIDQDDVETTFDASKYKTDFNGPLAKIVLKTGMVWPILDSSSRPSSAVAITFSSGYLNTSISPAVANVPETMKLAVKLLVGHMYENREATTPLTIAEIPMGIRYLLNPFVVWETRL